MISCSFSSLVGASYSLRTYRTVLATPGPRMLTDVPPMADSLIAALYIPLV
jgi:hypothetical protein